MIFLTNGTISLARTSRIATTRPRCLRTCSPRDGRSIQTFLTLVSLVAGVGACTPSSGTTGAASGGTGRLASGGTSGTGGLGGAGSGGAPNGGSGGGPAASGGSGTGGLGSDSGGAVGASSGGGSAGGPGTGGAASTPDASSDAPVDKGSLGGSSASTGGGPADSGQPAGCAGLFCEDFESGAINPSIWSVNQSSGQTVTVQKTTVAHGKFAAQFHALPNVLSYDLIVTKSAPAGLRGHHFGRAYLNVTPKPPDQHMTFLFAGATGFPKFKYLEIASIHNSWQLSSQNLVGINANNSAVSGSSEAYSPPGGSIPLGQWFCLEWEFNDSPDQIRVFVNGKEDYAFTNILFGGTTTGQVGAFTQFGFGYYIWHPATYVFDVYYDDIVLDTKQVGCLP